MYVALDFPPGLYRNGTERQSRGRWFDGNLVRFFEGTIRPVGGWQTHSATTVTGKGRAVISWKDNALLSWCAVGTESNLYAMAQAGTLSDVTPAGFVSGNADATAGGGYGTGNYSGAGAYGAPTPDTTSIVDCTVWSLDTFGQYLVGGTVEDGKLYQWQLNVSTPAAVITNAPTSCRGCFVTDERFLVALGASGVPRRVQWSDQGNNTVWTPLTNNQAGSFDLQSVGKLMLGKRLKNGALILTTFEAYLMSYIGGVLIYRFDRIGEGCGVISQRGAAAFGGSCAWMGKSGFWLYNGFVQPLPCDVQDYVFGNINLQQISKVTAHVDSAYGEVTWHYPSAGSLENDSYVTWSYRAYERGQIVWTYGSIARLSGTDRGPFQYPLRVGNDGYVYDHEIGTVYQDHSGTAQTPYLESAPFELGNGDYVMYATQLVPDEKTLGDVTATFKVRFYPEGAETAFGPYTLSKSTDVRFCGRQAKIHFTGAANDDWRIGSFRLDLKQGGRR